MEKMRKASIHDVAKYSVCRLQQLGASISPLKLQKILYYIQAWHLVYFEKQSLFDEEPEAWVNGPVYREVYEEYKSIGIYDQILPSFFSLTQETLGSEVAKMHTNMNLCQVQWDFLEATYAHYGMMDHDRLVMLTHSERPWNIARNGKAPFEYSDQKIKLEDMYCFYKGLLAKISSDERDLRFLSK